ncbi:MAG: hypothetical protein Fur0037_20760 [Planctomycetota bacterium]
MLMGPTDREHLATRRPTGFRCNVVAILADRLESLASCACLRLEPSEARARDVGHGALSAGGGMRGPEPVGALRGE